MNHKALCYILSVVVVAEGALIVQTLLLNYKKSEVIKTLQEVSNYYVHLLDEHEVPLNDYDRMALNTIIGNSRVFVLDPDID